MGARPAEGSSMRWEDFRTSSNVEDRRGMGMGGGGLITKFEPESGLSLELLS